MNIELKYMKRALQLAECGRFGASPNPMVGAVIVTPEGTIAGEGYHRRCGSAHAEVNAVADLRGRYGSDADQVLRQCTMYVTLEPCAHYGKTPPCAKLLIDCGIPRVIVGTADPFAKVSGRGIAMMRNAGIEVVTGIMENECRELNRRFFTAHILHRPWVTIKWAQSSDGFIDCLRDGDGLPARFSRPSGSALVHRLRALHDGIAAGSGTFIADKPRLDCRLWPGGNAPVRIALDRRHRLPADSADMIADATDIMSALTEMYTSGLTSVLIEGGRGILQAVIDSGLWDEARVETAPFDLGERGSTTAPTLEAIPHSVEYIDGNTIRNYRNNWLDLSDLGVKNL
ncbi:MAG: bifunctional diaminohydroxyphosphoribosylaminopyrimidine deaminase/5-amino-6-(5-phosphoribosylamino)uracil reductase RibD [Muribaculaceae bacterium]|nr:bifunctional diaminohydroxyphosphoribosylaminopyrimidine deaminase/5-amino-6-(5-phosphoribosylamino)uracil reductase RibD [Muribaculaceae bacterium]